MLAGSENLGRTGPRKKNRKRSNSFEFHDSINKNQVNIFFTEIYVKKDYMVVSESIEK